MRFVFLIFIARLVEKRLWTRRHTPLVLDQSEKKNAEFLKILFWFLDFPFCQFTPPTFATVRH